MYQVTNPQTGHKWQSNDFQEAMAYLQQVEHPVVLNDIFKAKPAQSRNQGNQTTYNMTRYLGLEY